MLRILPFVAALVCCNALADHARGPYIGGNIAYVSTESIVPANANEDKIELPALELVGGYKYNGWLGIDVRYGLGLSDRDQALTGASGSVEYSIDSYQSFYYRPEVVNREAKLYFLFGYTTVDATTESFTGTGDAATSNGEVSYSESGTSYGMGAGWFVGDTIVVNVEYRQLLDDKDEEFSVVTLGADYRF